MVFVIEGHDLSGKTTVAQKLAEKFNILYVKPWADLTHPVSSLTSISRTLLNVAMGLERDLILDRFITSEYVYGHIHGRETEYLSPLLEEWVQSVPLIVLQSACVSDEELGKRYYERGDHMYDLDALLLIKHEYGRLSEFLPKAMKHEYCSDLMEFEQHVVNSRLESL